MIASKRATPSKPCTSVSTASRRCTSPLDQLLAADLVWLAALECGELAGAIAYRRAGERSTSTGSSSHHGRSAEGTGEALLPIRFWSLCETDSYESIGSDRWS